MPEIVASAVDMHWPHMPVAYATAVPRPRVIAHRACPLDAPENSLTGIRRAAALGADAVEVDARLTRDGVAVLLHDASPWRVARHPVPVRWLSASGFTSLRHRGTDEHLATFAQALATLPPGLSVAVDLKAHAVLPAVAAAVAAAGLVERTMVWARSPEGVGDAHRLLAGATTALLRDTSDEDSTLRYLHDAHACGARQVSIHQRRISARVVDQAVALGLEALVWVVEPDGHEAVLDLGVAGVVTDWPATARRLVA